MNLSARLLCAFGLVSASVFALGCAQPGAGLPSSPSAVSAGPSAGAAGPGASYDATGLWHFVSSNARGTDEESFDAYVTQDADGNLSFVDGDGAAVTLERVGTGAVIAYTFSFLDPEGGTDCSVLVQGTARLDTRTNTLTGNLLLRELGCAHQVLPGLTVTATRLS